MEYFVVDTREFTRVITQIGTDNWSTLSTLMAYADEKGVVSVNQTEIARALGVSRQAVNRRIHNLAQCTVDTRPVIRIDKLDNDVGGLKRNVYHILVLRGDIE